MATATVNSHARPLHVPAGRGSREVWWIDGTVAVKLTGEESGGSLGVWEFDARRGAATPMHVHHREDEQFLVLEGAATFVVGDERFDAGPGDLVVLPRGIPHGYVITSDRARVVGMVTPAGFESFFSELGAPIVPGEPEGPPPALDAMAAALARYDNEIVGPPPSID